MQKELENKQEKKRKRSFKARVLIFFVNLLLILVACVGLYVLFVFLQMPSLDSVLHETREPAIIFLDKDGREIRADSRIMGAAVTVEELPPYVWQSIVAIEDKRFFKHGAISYRGTLRAVFLNLFQGHFAAGGSTITQQTVKNIFLSSDKKVSRKIQELILSMWLENRFTKNQILDLYMNRISLVGGMRGIDAAATSMFGHGANELTLAESAQIAAMLKAPTAYSPLKNPERNIKRATIILKEMAHQGYITPAEADIAIQQLKPAAQTADKNMYRYWTDYVKDEVESRLGAKYFVAYLCAFITINEKQIVLSQKRKN